MHEAWRSTERLRGVWSWGLALVLTVCPMEFSSRLTADEKPAAKPALNPALDKEHAAWPQILGPHRNGVSSETGLLKKWPAAGPKEVWRSKGGIGMSGLAIRDGRLMTVVQKEGPQFAIALDPQAGSPLWEVGIGPAYRNQMGDGPRATPTISGEMLYVFTGSGVLLGLRAQDGKQIWRREVLTELKGEPADYGMACSPLVAAELVIVTAGAPGAAVVAYQKQTGELAWKTGDDTAGYSSPALLNLGGKPQVVAFTGKAAVGLLPETGKELWRYPYTTDFDCNIATPLEHDGQVFLSSGENHGCALLSLKPSDGTYAVKEVWTSFGPRSVMRNEWQTSVLIDGILYGMDNVGGAGPVTNLNCVDIKTGDRLWQQPRYGKGNLIAADGKLFLIMLNGELVVAAANRQEYEEWGRTKVMGPTRTAPALAGGLLYLRDNSEIVCLDVRESAAAGKR